MGTGSGFWSMRWGGGDGRGVGRWGGLSVLEVSQTGDRVQFEEIQSLPMTTMSEVSWTGPGCGRFRGLPCKPGGIGDLGGAMSENQCLGGRAVAGFLDSVRSSSGQSTKPPTSLRNLRHPHGRVKIVRFLGKVGSNAG